VRPSVQVLVVVAACSFLGDVTAPVVSPTTMIPARLQGAACFPEQVQIERFCIDPYEAYVVELDERDNESPHSPYAVIAKLRVRAKFAANVVPQAYISQLQSTEACANAGKRLCTADEFLRACRGPDKTAFYPYGGRQHAKAVCNEGKGSFVALVFGQDARQWTYGNFNDPQLNQLENGLAKTGTYDKCVSPERVFDLVGNLDEWVDEPPGPRDRGHFRGGWYGDAELNGPGCMYVTSAHERTYHDYSTGFRCCASTRGRREEEHREGE
jgi:sulfatase modifying factor 1